MYPVGIDFALPFTIEGRPRRQRRGAARRHPHRHAGYFETMKIALLKGRFIDAAIAGRARRHRHQRDDGAALLSPARIRSARSCAIPHGKARSSASSAT
jgi:hypothetical protein